MSKRLKVAVAGAGYFSQFHYDAWSRIDEVEVVACADLSTDKAKAMADRHGIAQVFDAVPAMLDAVRPDVLDIAMPPDTHRGAIAQAVERGIAVICQKAFCRSLDEAREAVELAERSRVPLIVHENFRFQPWHREAKRILEQGRLGAPYQVCFRMRPGDGQGPRAYLDRQPYFQKMPRFLVHETGIHFIDTFRFFFGEVRSVYADLRRLNPAIAGEDAGVVVFEFDAGRRGILDGNRLADHVAHNRRLTMGEMDIEGSQGTLRLDGDGRLFERRHGANEETPVAYAWSNTGFAGDSVHATLRSATDALLGRHPPENDGRAYLANLAVEEAIYRSAAEGRRIALDANA